MRPSNQNKRSRGRSGGRKHTSPLSRNFESNGPDVKIRGNAAHIAEKYVQLARDAQASGDSVMAENYFQHAEHYFRIVSAAQAQNPQRSEQPQQQADSDSDDMDTDTQGETVKADTSSQEGKAPQEAASADQGADSEEQESPRKPRERRPRRKPRVAEEAAANPAEAPQPDVGDLPAFLTGGGQADAAE